MSQATPLRTDAPHLIPRRSLIARLAVALSAALLLCFSLACGISILVGSKSLEREVSRNLQETAGAVLSEIRAYISLRYSEVELWSSLEVMEDVALQDLDFRIQNSLLGLQRLYPEIYRELTVIAPSGRIVATTNARQAYGHIEISALSFHVIPGRKVRATEAVVSGPDSIHIMILASPIRSSFQAEPVGEFLAFVSLAPLDRIVANATVEGSDHVPTRLAFVADQRGRVLAEDPRIAAARRAPLGLLPIAEQVLEGWEGYARHVSDLHRYPELAPLGWQVSVLASRREAFAVVRVFVLATIAAALIGLVLAVVGTMAVARTVSRRIGRLLAGTERLSLGDLDHRIPEDVSDELGDLARSFNTMAASLSSTMKSEQATMRELRDRDATLESARLELEEKVRLLKEEIVERERAQAALEASQERLRHSQRMEAFGKLAGGVAHDFNNILVAILGHGQLLLHECGDVPRVRQRAEGMISAAERAARLTRQLLAFSRKQVVSPKVVALDVVVGSMEKMFGRLIGEHLELRMCLNAPEGWVRIDEGQLEQIVLNLVVNARDAMPGGGRITVETSVVSIDKASPGASGGMAPGVYVSLTVRDTGSGIDPEVLPHIFEPFFTTKRAGEGTGLGLATVCSILDQYGGLITVESQWGVQSTFHVILPRVEKAAQEALACTPCCDEPAKGGTILVVEDDFAVRSLVVETLRGAGYTVLEAVDGLSGLDTARSFSGPMDLVVTDMVMPGKNGKEMFNEIAALRPGTRALYMSGYTEIGIVTQGILEEGIAFQQKPFTPAELLRRVRECLDRPGPRVAAQRDLVEAAPIDSSAPPSEERLNT